MLDQQKRYVFNQRDLEKIFPEDSKHTLHAGLEPLVRQNILERAARGIYLYALSHHKKGPDTLELIAKTLRHGAIKNALAGIFTWFKRKC
ncbi:hypothetical protein EMM73_03930 [Rheinheimera sediminis]|uniref:hypothetical protein n=1 Tax=Rheinheimera sp. YQF-1 TaxID=2499626 RepID=UPI000FD98004|nr:hypothetical protein [Rheinheimera sp. YQF-1]RVT47907.1 hypothetical protein EMM73_03930 [Rheinheimera sp. YQF-1]